MADSNNRVIKNKRLSNLISNYLKKAYYRNYDNVLKSSDSLNLKIKNFFLSYVDLLKKNKKKKIFKAFASPPSFINRKKVYEQIVTGYLVIDTLLPLGKGQRALIAGDRQTGKSSIAIDTIINQAENILFGNTPLFCIYVAIGQKCSSVAYLLSTFRKYSCYRYTSVVSATAGMSAGLQYLAPFTGCALGESYMYTGRHSLVIYDDLSKHAIAYRQISLLLKRLPGREAYPTDIFWLHAQLLERAAQLDDSNGGGSMTALPIVETVGGSVSSYIVTNLISITDGQIYTDEKLFNSNIKPAVNVGFSVSRVGSTVQCKGVRSISGDIKLKLMLYWELEMFGLFDGDSVDKVTRALLEEGLILIEFFKQPLHTLFNLVEQLILLSSIRYKYIFKCKINQVKMFKYRLLGLLNNFFIYNNYFYWLYNTKFCDSTNQSSEPDENLKCLLEDTCYFTDKNLLSK